MKNKDKTNKNHTLILVLVIIAVFTIVLINIDNTHNDNPIESGLFKPNETKFVYWGHFSSRFVNDDINIIHERIGLEYPVGSGECYLFWIEDFQINCNKGEIVTIPNKKIMDYDIKYVGNILSITRK